jgi:glycosyltransferase involved in cell wall biosynthesis
MSDLDFSNMSSAPLVSVGIPTFNRPLGLRRTLECITNQTYRNLEIVVSDNASPGVQTEAVVREFMVRDERIRYHRHADNRGPLFNFRHVLDRASGEFFMWAADDDAWDREFVATLIKEFSRSDPSVVAIASEAQYTVAEQPQPFFSEGTHFYAILQDSAFERVRHVILHNYGNLFYSLFKISALRQGKQTVFDKCARSSLNEIPIFIQVAERGSWKVIPRVLFYKETSQGTYRSARWEMIGGVGPSRTWRQMLSLIKSAIYHLEAFFAIRESILQLEAVSIGERKSLVRLALVTLSTHFLQLIQNRKSLRPAA